MEALCQSIHIRLSLACALCSENDAGVRAQSASKYSTALQHFTEAIRLAPTKAAYHSNRAAAALKLGQFAMALGDARCA